MHLVCNYLFLKVLIIKLKKHKKYGIITRAKIIKNLKSIVKRGKDCLEPHNQVNLVVCNVFIVIGLIRR